MKKSLIYVPQDCVVELRVGETQKIRSLHEPDDAVRQRREWSDHPWLSTGASCVDYYDGDENGM